MAKRRPAKKTVKKATGKKAVKKNAAKKSGKTPVSAIDPARPEVVPHLLGALDSVNVGRRYEAMNRIEWMGEFALPYVDRLIELLDENEFRCRAAQVLGSIGPMSAAAIPKLAKLMYGVDHESVVASDAVNALGRTAHPDAAAHLLKALDDGGKLDDVLKALRWMPQHADIFLSKLRSMLSGPYRLKAVEAYRGTRRSRGGCGAGRHRIA
jgi:HEAT repeat protein